MEDPTVVEQDDEVVEIDDAAQEYEAVSRPLTTEEKLANIARKAKERKQKLGRLEATKAEEEAVASSMFGGFFEDGAPDEKDGFVDNTMEVVLTAAEKAAESIVHFVGDITDQGFTPWDFAVKGAAKVDKFIAEKTGKEQVQFLKEVEEQGTGIWGTINRRQQDLFELENGYRKPTLQDYDYPDVDRPDSPAGQMAADMLRWLAIFAATRRGLGAAPTKTVSAVKGAAAGFTTDISVFGPQEERLSAMAKEWGIETLLTDYLAEDSGNNMENRLKHGIEGLGMGLSMEGVMGAFRWLKGFRAAKKFDAADPGDVVLTKDVQPSQADLDALKAEPPPQVAVEAGESQTERWLKQKQNADAQQGKTTAREGVEEAAEEVAEKITIRDAAKSSFRFKNEIDVEKFAEDFQSGNFRDLGAMTEFNEDIIDLSKVDNAEDLIAMLRGMEDAAGDMLGEAGKAKVSFAASKAMAKQLGYSEKTAHELFNSVQAEGGLTSRMLASHQAQIAHAKKLMELGELAANGGQKEVAEFHAAISRQAAIMAYTKGSQREIARAMANMRQMRDASADTFEAFEEVLRRHGGIDGTRELADQLTKTHSLHDLHRIVEKTQKTGWLDVLQEVAINGMLSSIKSHVVNITSNSAMGLIINPLTRMVSGTIGLRHNRYALRNEIHAVARTYMAIPKAGLSALKALAKGSPIFDYRQRAEILQRRAIRVNDVDNFVGGKMMAHTINAVGEIVRLPGRALMAADEFFKVISAEGELTSLAWEAAELAADQADLVGKPRREFVKKEAVKLMKNPTHEMNDQATSVARRATFQEDAQTVVGGRMAGFLNSNPLIKLVVAPFVKTPMNILRQAFVDSNPILSLWAKGNLEAMRQGGRAADMVLARMAIGTGVMVSGWQMAQDGIIVGKGRDFGNTEKMDQIPEYSIKIGDEYIPYNRLDPVGSMLGLMADLHWGFTHRYDANDPEGYTEAEAHMMTVFAAVTQNALSKTWAKSMNDIIESFDLMLEGSPGSMRRARDKILAENAFKAVPFGSAIRNYAGSEDPVIREAFTFTERMLKNIPENPWTQSSKDLPIKRDLLGRPITRKNVDSYMWNPFAPVEDSKDPVDIELAKLEFDATLIDKSINGVPLTAQQYSRYKELIGDFGKPGVPTLYDQIASLIENPAWDTWTKDMRTMTVKDMVSRRKETAKAMLMREQGFSLQKRSMQVDRYKLEKLTGRKLDEVKKAIESIR